jgi:hypothetical protein
MMDITMAADGLSDGRADERDSGTNQIADVAPVRSRLQAVTDPSSHIPTYAGILVVLAGFGLIALAWARVAGLVDVWKQMPYVVSAGLPGLGLIMTGLLVINIAAKRQDAAVRARQMETLTEALRDLKRTLDDQ